MADSRAQCVDELESALGDEVLRPGSAGYAAALASLFFADAATRRPLCVVQPGDAGDVATAMRVASECACQVTARGGSHSSLCVADDAVMLDLATHMNTAEVVGDDVRIGGGVTMTHMLAAMAPRGRVVPVGVAPTPGMGLVLRGGVGYLTREYGLTLDHLREVEIVIPSGERLTLSDASTGDDADLWWGVRGSGPSFGVVTSATLRTRELGNVFVKRLIVGSEALPAYFRWAMSLPRDTNASVVLGSPAAGPGAPVIYLCVVYSGDDEAGVRRVEGQVQEFLAAVGVLPLYETADRCAYRDVPPFDVPGLDGSPVPAPPPGEQVLAYIKACWFDAPLDEASARAVATAMAAAPTPLCRMDLQHLGGAMAEVGRTDTAFWHRDALWNWVVTGVWLSSQDEREAVMRWVRETVRSLAAQISGPYIVEVRPGFPETEAEVAAAFGDNLPRLRTLKRRWDPADVLGHYYPLEPGRPAAG